MARALAKKAETSTTLLEAAKKVLRQNGHSGLSTRDVAAAAGVPLSQIHYHFGSKQGMMLALFDHLNAQLLDRQNAMFHDTTLTLSQRWDRACDYLDEDIASGYVRVLQELIAASWSDPTVAKVVRTGLMGWFELIVGVACQAERELGGLGPFSTAEIATLTGGASSAEKASICSAGETRLAGAPGAAKGRRCHSHRRSQIVDEDDVMRAKLPNKEGFVERDGVRIHYEVYGQGRQTMVFLPPWSIVHSRVYKAQLPYFSERFRCIAFDARATDGPTGPTMSPPTRWRTAWPMRWRHGRHRCRPGHRGRPLLRRPARLRAGRVPSGTGEGCHPGRYDGGHRAHPQAHVAAAFHGPAGVPRWEASGWNKYNRAHWLADYPDFAEHFIRSIFTEPHSTRQIEEGIAWAGDTDGPVLVKTVEARTIVPPFDVTESMYRRIHCPVWRSMATTTRSSPMRAQARGRAHRCRVRDHR